MTIILGIDPGTNITGYGIIRKTANAIEPIDYGCIRPPAKLELPQRYEIIFTSIEALIERYRPEVLVVESQFVLKNVQSTIKLGMAKAMAILAAARAKIKIHEYSATKAKKAVVGHGLASKHQVQQMIGAILRLPAPPNPEDAADALALAICHANNLKGVFPCTNTSAAALRKKIPIMRSSKQVASDIDSQSP